MQRRGVRALRATWLAAFVVATSAAGCAAPMLSQDGQLVFTEPGGRRGASVLTANGVQFMDSAEVPQPVERRSASEPWRAPTGFLLPRDGVWRETSKPVPIQGRGLAVVLRSSDTLVPSWGGEILLRLDAIAPAAAFPAAAPSVRAPIHLAIVIDGREPDTAALASVALDDLGEQDRVMLVDAANAGAARTVVPLVPGTNRTLLAAAIERLGTTSATARDLPGALGLAKAGLAGATKAMRRVLVLSDGRDVQAEPVARAVRELVAAGALVGAVGTSDATSASALAPLGAEVTAGVPRAAREDAIADAVPPPGDVVLSDVELTISSVPAPARLIELSGGTAALTLDHDRISLGELYAGEARTEVARVAIPTWVPGEPLELTVTARYVDHASGAPLTADATIRCRYSEDVEKIANARHGDVIAYASGLAMVRRLRRAFEGSRVDGLGGLRPVVTWQARSLGVLAQQTGDRALGEEAEILTALLGAIPD